MKDNKDLFEDSTIENDPVGSALIALNTMAVISDDLYSILGEDDKALNENDLDAIMNAYEIVSDIHDRINPDFDFPSEDEYGDDIDEDFIFEELDNTFKKVLADHGFVESKVSSKTWKPKYPIEKLYGIPMRAGAFADTFVVYAPAREKPFIIHSVDKDTTLEYENSKDLVNELKKRSKMESILKWNDGEDAILESREFDSNEVMDVLNKLLPVNTGTDKNGKVAFSSTKERDDAAESLVNYFKTIKESNAIEIDLGNINEEIDEVKFNRLARTGLVPKEDVNKVIKALKQLASDKPLSLAQKDLISATFLSLVGLVTGDSSVFAKISRVTS